MPTRCSAGKKPRQPKGLLSSGALKSNPQDKTQLAFLMKSHDDDDGATVATVAQKVACQVFA